MMNVFPFSLARAVQMLLPTRYLRAPPSVWINGDWRAAESGWCGVINQHNECR